jgi:hypothetical protein
MEHCIIITFHLFLTTGALHFRNCLRFILWIDTSIIIIALSTRPFKAISIRVQTPLQSHFHPFFDILLITDNLLYLNFQSLELSKIQHLKILVLRPIDHFLINNLFQHSELGLYILQNKLLVQSCKFVKRYLPHHVIIILKYNLHLPLLPFRRVYHHLFANHG